MRIHFMINGIGLGHVYRDLPIMKALAKRHKITTSTFGIAARILDENGYPDSYLLNPFGDVVAHGAKVNVHRSLIENLKKLSPGLIKKTSDIISDCRPDVVVVDGYLLGLFAAKMHGKMTVNIANCTKLWYVFPKISRIVESGSDVLSRGAVDSSDIVIVPDFAPPLAFALGSIEYFGAEQKFHFVGPMALVKEKKKGRKPLVGMGGSGARHKNLEEIAHMLDKMGYSPVVADGSLAEEEVQEAIATSPFAVVHGGHTTIMSCISANAPVIPVPVKGYTERMNNALGAERAGCGVMLDPEFVDRSTAKLAIEKIKTHYVRENTRLFSVAAHEMMGHLRAAGLIESLSKKKNNALRLFR